MGSLVWPRERLWCRTPVVIRKNRRGQSHRFWAGPDLLIVPSVIKAQGKIHEDQIPSHPFSVSFRPPNPPFARAQKSMHGRRMRGGQGHPPCWVPEDLHLTVEQIQKLKSRQGSYLRDINVLRSDLLNKRYILGNLISDPTLKAGEIKERREEILALEDQIQKRILDYQARVGEILLPQQFNLWISGDQTGFGTRIRHRRGMDIMKRPD